MDHRLKRPWFDLDIHSHGIEYNLVARINSFTSKTDRIIMDFIIPIERAKVE